MGKFIGYLTLYLIIVFASFTSTETYGQISTTPSQAQIEQFKRLPKQQQEALAKQFGIDISQISGAVSNSSSVTEPAIRPEMQYVNNLATQNSVEKVSVKDKTLKPFGYDMFDQLQAAFIPGGTIPVPADYILGPGDTLDVTLYGKNSVSYTVTINNEGQIYIPELEPMNVSGLTFLELKSHIANVVDEKTIGFKSSVAIVDLRGIQVYVVGDVKKPGAYHLSSLSTVTNALFISGGPTLVGSLRNIYLKRGGNNIARLDLYKVFTQGDVSQDNRLQQGDVIFVDSVKRQVSVTGEVRRPAIYEVTSDDSVKDLVQYAGGLTMNAYPKNVVLASFDNNYQRQVSALDLTESDSNNLSLKNGDVVTVMPVSQQFSDVVNVAGAVARPGMYTWQQGMKLSQLINSHDDILPTTDLTYALVVTHGAFNQYQVQQFSPSGVFSGDDVKLSANDLVVFFSQFEHNTFDLVDREVGKLNDVKLDDKLKNSKNTHFRIETDGNYLFELQHGDLFSKQKALIETKRYSRRQLIRPIIQLITDSQQGGELVPVVEITGQVRFPGVYPLSKGAGLEQMVAAAGGLTESANFEKGEISRIVQTTERGKDTNHLSFNLVNDDWRSIKLEPRDVVNFFQQANWQEELKVTLTGEVMFPGTYTIKEGETLSEVVARAGGLTQFAAPEAAFFTRQSLKILEQQQAKNMARNLSKELAFKSISSSYSNVNISEVQLLVDKLTTVEGVGRLVIDLEKIIAAEASPLKLENGDQLHVPTYRDEVNIIGEVQVATTHLHDENWQLEDYLNSSGGLRQQADEDRIYIIRANGLVDVPDDSWFGRTLKIRAGDTIVVPLDAGYTDQLTLWEKATSIFYQLTVGLAALGRI
ncbi:SLBB domain-containing protein [Psychrosphaera sp. B3R10]|uniref:SLBB domain-containing protein n=2 Tax=Psychrosphaera TaxID=907197 RepID=UPI001C08ABD9|nr:MULTISPECIES: SLBB domain-containing protein [unclassified Psychrosphaera]MBU2881819.1 SLBB domain-containing protein [Psychrosphaera sp. I2R16]MBU2989209.1 SLBB domain-containing protein [Psychrosphaera sp. B3R10]